MTFSDIFTPVAKHAARDPEHPAFVFGGRTITYGALIDEARRLATVLEVRGIAGGDRVAIFSPNRPEIFSAYLALAILGAAIVPVNAEFSAHEVRHIIDHGEIRMLIHGSAQAGTAGEACAGAHAQPLVTEFEALLGEAAVAPVYRGPVLGSGDDLALLCYTSGTTSLPKGVAATHRNELVSAQAYSDMMAIKPEDRELIALPLTFSFGFHAAAYVALFSGATIQLLPRFHPRDTLEAIEVLCPTIFLGVPTMFAMMADVATKDERSYDLGSLRLAAASGAALTDKIVSDFRAQTGVTVLPYYAMTEVRPIFSFDLQTGTLPPPGSVGRLIPPTEVRLVEESGADALCGQPGELWVRGPSFSGAYFRDPERTAASMAGDWFRTGDLVVCDAEGNYFIVGRSREQIISGGAKIAPIEVETALLAHPAISDVAVVGSPDPIFGQVVKAVVVTTDPNLGPEAVIDFCRGRVADYKVPRIVTFMETLPLAPSGKVLKTALV
ncbi:conserved membrane hypothetical protein [Hyphomicrobiales bacterium]|nr:conserved membrane hypothetical protein [Hyphomicrobiales bacterium]CAH1692286.1 Long-chain fatty acid--CoA ligase [Hyphomicrobiales bacterium]